MHTTWKNNNGRSNNADPGNVSSHLHGLTQIKEILIVCACPIMWIYHKHGGQCEYNGHGVNLSQNIKEFLSKLPINVKDLLILIVHWGLNLKQRH